MSSRASIHSSSSNHSDCSRNFLQTQTLSPNLPIIIVFFVDYCLLETLQQTTTSQVTFAILPVPTSAVYPAPVELANRLKLAVKKNRMKSTFTNFDSDFVINPIEFKRYQVGFSALPTILNVSFNQINVSCNLDNYGYIYATAVKIDEDLGKPSSFQVASGLSYQNIPVPSNFTEIGQKFALFNVTVNYLESDTTYNLYMTAGSAHPGYPDLMNDSMVIFLNFSTPKAPVKPRLNIEASHLAAAAICIIAVLAALI
jgi:hypothetical protein